MTPSHCASAVPTLRLLQPRCCDFLHSRSSVNANSSWHCAARNRSINRAFAHSPTLASAAHSLYRSVRKRSLANTLKMSFTVRLTIVILASAILAVIVAPFAAAAVSAMGFRFPFPRIFDRTVMVIAVITQARALRAIPLLRSGFAHPIRNLPRATRGFLIAIVAIALLVYLAAFMGAHASDTSADLWRLIPKYFISAIAIAIIEEGFFRAFLLRGMEGDFGRTAALLLSSAIYSITHLIRSPAKFYV